MNHKAVSSEPNGELIQHENNYVLLCTETVK